MNRSGRLALPGFFLSGFLLGLVGAVLPAWGYHLTPSYAPLGSFFLCVFLGIVYAEVLLRHLVRRWSAGAMLSLSCGLASAALLFLAWAGPPSPEYWRLIGWMGVGVAAGLLNAALFDALAPDFQSHAARTIRLASVSFGLGCLASAVLVAGVFYLYSTALVLSLFAAIPGALALAYFRRFDQQLAIPQPLPVGAVFREFLSPGAVMFGLLLFLQSGSEWSVAGWLPVYLIRRLGFSPVRALSVLALFWFSLLAGRVLAVYLLKRARRGRILLTSATLALLGCLLLMMAANTLGAAVGAVFCGTGFAFVYPLVVERIGGRFPYYHAGVFNSIFSFGLAGGMLAPWAAGWLADAFGLWIVMGLPVLGTLMVVILLLLIWLESKVTGR